MSCLLLNSRKQTCLYWCLHSWQFILRSACCFTGHHKMIACLMSLLCFLIAITFLNPIYASVTYLSRSFWPISMNFGILNKQCLNFKEILFIDDCPASFFIKLWVAFSFQMSGSLTLLFRYLCVSWHKRVNAAFLEEI